MPPARHPLAAVFGTLLRRVGGRPVPPGVRRTTHAAVLGLAAAACAVAASPPPSTPGPAAERTATAYRCSRTVTNHAWGYYHSGVYVDADGAAYRYAHASGDGALTELLRPPTTAEALVRFHAPGRERIAQLSPAERDRMAALVRTVAAEPEAQATRNTGADQGELASVCYVADAPGGTYRRVLLVQQGDWETESSSPAAMELHRRLTALAQAQRR